MSALELKVPPVAVALVVGSLMRVGSRQWPGIAYTMPGRVAVSTALAGMGLILAVAGVVEFRKARTTFSPTQPGAVSILVTSGVYRLSRNPMYLGLLLVLGGWAVFLSHPLAFLFLPGFVAYMNRFQISAEERALAAKFANDFAAYKQSVSRWL